MSGPRTPVTRKTIREAIQEALAECATLKQPADGSEPSPQMWRDTHWAITYLTGLRDEIDGVTPMREIPTACFTRYIIDEEPVMQMPKDLRDYIAEIEDVYATRVWMAPRR